MMADCLETEKVVIYGCLLCIAHLVAIDSTSDGSSIEGSLFLLVGLYCHMMMMIYLLIEFAFQLSLFMFQSVCCWLLFGLLAHHQRR